MFSYDLLPYNVLEWRRIAYMIGPSVGILSEIEIDAINFRQWKSTPHELRDNF